MELEVILLIEYFKRNTLYNSNVQHEIDIAIEKELFTNVQNDLHVLLEINKNPKMEGYIRRMAIDLIEIYIMLGSKLNPLNLPLVIDPYKILLTNLTLFLVEIDDLTYINTDNKRIKGLCIELSKRKIFPNGTVLSLKDEIKSQRKLETKINLILKKIWK